MTDSNNTWSKHAHYKQDPFPDIAPALLNSADIGRYVGEGCLIGKENFHRDRLKPASYEMRFLGELYNWQEVHGRLKQCRRTVSNGECVTLHKNSISYLWTEEKLLLPEYIAARFNLRIREVHKGILLGTGPLIDPGFGGQILIPLHNLTDNDYEIKGGDGIIWVEFTKVSKNDYWLPEGGDIDRPPELIAFPDKKLLTEWSDYLNKADVMKKGGVQSAFGGALKRAQRHAKSAKSASNEATDQVDKVQDAVRKLGFWGAIGVGIGLLAVFISSLALTTTVVVKVQSQGDRIGELERRLQDLV